MVKSILILFVCIVLGFFYIRYIELRSIFIPTREVITTPQQVDLPFEDIFFKTEDSIELNGWFIKSPKAKATIIFAHGNGGNICHRLEKIAFFYHLGINTFIFDYRGYGKSKGKPTEEGIYKDGRAAFDYLIRRDDIDRKKIIAYGESIGGAVAIDLATHRDVACVIAESTFSSAKEMGKIVYPFLPSFLFISKFDSITKVKNLKTQKLFIHSRNDEIVPFSLGKKLFDAAAQPKELLTITGGHNTGFIESKYIILERLKKYLKKIDLL
ncbi:alpha/beta hydrolase [Candidatus Omnitrophota bacterium]